MIQRFGGYGKGKGLPLGRAASVYGVRYDIPWEESRRRSNAEEWLY